MLVSDVFDGVKLVETSTKKLNEATSTIINKMGYTTYPDAFKKFLGASDEEMLLLTSYPESHVQEAIELINKQGGTQKFRELLQERFVQSKELIGDMPEFKMVLEQHNEQLKMLEFIEKYSESLKVFPKAWDDFCSKEGFVTGLHSTTPWYKAEMAIFGVELIEKMHANSWGNGLKQILLQTIDNAEKSLPKGKAFGFDIKRLKMILEESSTPQIAKQRLADELRSKPMPPKDLYPEGVVLGEEAIIMNLNALLGEVF